jgi:hypothetical protein
MTTDLHAGIGNLLEHCAGVQSGESLLVVHEDPDLGWYDAQSPIAVANKARTMGLTTTLLEVGAPGLQKDTNLLQQISNHDCTIFFARVGDQDRFDDNAGQERSVMVYARDASSLSSSFGRVHHRAMIEFKEAVNDVVLNAGRVTITCPLGTDYSGNVSAVVRDNDIDVTVKRFPLGVPQPVPAGGFSGRVALARYLTPTGSLPYLPASCRIDGTVMAMVEKGRITGFEGSNEAVSAVRNHYDQVSRQLGVEADCVHSWHAGIHPGSAYLRAVEDNPDHWSNNVFTHPRFLHFHTCGNYAPGEICWMVLDPTIIVDDTSLWDNGKMMPHSFSATAAVLRRWPELESVFDAPAGPIGVRA